MRLIDADKICVIPATNDNITGMGMTREEQDAYNEGVEAVMAKIRNAKTIDKPLIAICDSAENFDPVYCAERADDVVYSTGREDALLEVLEIIDELCTDEDNGKMIAGRMVYILASEFRNRVLGLKGSEHESRT